VTYQGFLDVGVDVKNLKNGNVSIENINWVKAHQAPPKL
jgi:hypothetical protein